MQGESLDEVHEQLAARTPEGFRLIKAPVAMAKASTEISATGTYARRDTIREVETATREEALAAAPEGWQLLHIIEI